MGSNEKNDLKSVSRLNVLLDMQGLETIEYELVRHLAPFTINRVFNALPISDTVHFYDNKFVYIQTKLQVGAEKPRTSFKPGDLAFLTNSSSICFFLQECSVTPMNPMGMAKSSINLLSGIKVGSIITLKK